MKYLRTFVAALDPSRGWPFCKLLCVCDSYNIVHVYTHFDTSTNTMSTHDLTRLQTWCLHAFCHNYKHHLYTRFDTSTISHTHTHTHTHAYQWSHITTQMLIDPTDHQAATTAPRGGYVRGNALKMWSEVWQPPGRGFWTGECCNIDTCIRSVVEVISGGGGLWACVILCVDSSVADVSYCV